MNMMKTAIVCAGVLALATPGPLVAAGGGRSSAALAQNRYGSASRFDQLTGTYELDRSRSDDPQRIAENALRDVPASERSAAMNRVMSRLNPPDVLAVDRQDTRVSLASSRIPEIVLDADGRTRTERGASGRQMTTRATLNGDRLEVSTTGTGGSDFSATFEPLDNGRALRVTRRVFDERVRQPIVMQSVYRKTSDTANWDVYQGASNDRPYNASRSASSRAYGNNDTTLVPDGATLVARLDNAIDLKSAKLNDRVTLTVSSAPTAELEGATIEGYLSDTPSSSVNGQSGVAMEFDTIRLSNGRSGPFTGTVDSVRSPNGETIPSNRERVEPANDQRQQAIERGAVGAAIGALIGAVAGGGKGAAVGAVIGGGGAAATVFLPIDQLNQPSLASGTEFTIRADAPRRR
jgi:hypothetical protein